MGKSANITFLLFTYNEARRIEHVLRCFNPYGKIVVMDNHSTDATREIAKRHNAAVYEHDHPGYVEEETVAENALSKVGTEWVYWAYADEVLPKPLLEKLVEVAKSNSVGLVNIPRKNIHYGIPDLNLDSGAPSPRFFRKDAVDFSGNPIHSIGRFTGTPNEILTLPNRNEYAIHHCSTYTLKKFELAHSNYSDIEATSGSRFNAWKMFWQPLHFFTRFYLLKGGWRLGWGAFIYTMQYCFFFFNTQAKIWELENNITTENIEKVYDGIKERLLGGGE